MFRCITVRKVVLKHDVQMTLIQETKISCIKRQKTAQLWSTDEFGYMSVDSNGQSGDKNFVSSTINVYAPQGKEEKQRLRQEFSKFINSGGKAHCIAGDLDAAIKE